MSKQLTPYLKAKLEYAYTSESEFVRIVEEYLLTKEQEEILGKYNLTVDAVLHMPSKEIPADIKNTVFADWNNQVGLKLFYLD
jgi:triphosphoribosyl-dephospho-CoA synthetase